MIVRLWITQVAPSQMAVYEQFEREHSRPMFEEQAGFLGVLFLRTSEGCAALSLWKDLDAVEALGSSESYQQTVARLAGSGLLVGHQQVTLFEVKGGSLRIEHFARVFSQETS